MRKFILLLLFLPTVLGAVAQDVIRRADGTQVEARVLEIDAREVRFKRRSNPQGPTYVWPLADVREIVYANGERDTFGPQHAAADSARPAVETSRPEASVARAAKPYVIGDYYDDGAVRGVVCELSEDRLHGLVLSLDEAYLPWCAFDKAELRSFGIADSGGGEANMRAVARYIADHGLTWDDFPAFAWCRGRGEGWYLPSIDEMLRICANYNGGDRTVNDRKARNRFNETLTRRGGRRMNRLAFYFTSTERDDRTALCTHTALKPPYVETIPKNTKFLVRAVHRF